MNTSASSAPEKKFSNLRGLLYFTDGMGSYPARRPAYDTAFLFLGDRFDDANVPPWAMKVVLDEDEFTGPSARSGFGSRRSAERRGRPLPRTEQHLRM